MKAPDHLKPQGFTLNMTPLIDIVFLLIVFFLVSSNLIQQDVSMEMDLPSAETAKLLEESQTHKIIVNVPKAGQIYVGAQLTQQEQLRSILAEHRSRNGAKSELRIRTNKDVAYGAVEPLLVLAAQCGIRDVSFAVAEKR